MGNFFSQDKLTTLCLKPVESPPYGQLKKKKKAFRHFGIINIFHVFNGEQGFLNQSIILYNKLQGT